MRHTGTPNRRPDLTKEARLILTESPANAKIRATALFQRINDINTPDEEKEKLWHEYRQAKANANPKLT